MLVRRSGQDNEEVTAVALPSPPHLDHSCFPVSTLLTTDP